ncbi:uncharacterized protein PAC_18743 [Phialocephala subalpina]|uniref:Uncharacterized protein n=1 Tax=Phialocephala subalpina TaxID=576137 RepID=A0A1L7XUY8_9HELO|nr:uncharacterized protein PAC_18743 [Phialocephala subalpina]
MGFPKFSRQEALAIYRGESRWNDEADGLVPAKISAQPDVCTRKLAVAGTREEETTTPKMANATFSRAYPSVQIRQKIYRLLFRRPVGLVPRIINYDRGGAFFQIYSYEWNIEDHQIDSRFGCDEYELPKYDGATRQWVCKTWKTKSIKEERALLASGALERKYDHFFPHAFKLPATNLYGAMEEERGGAISAIRNICTRHKQIMEEATYVLYGENAFVFDTRGKKGYYPHWKDECGIHAYDVFSKDRHLVPGLSLSDGQPASPVQVELAIGNMFCRDASQPIFFTAKDPLVKFFNEIGPENASKIRNIQMKGYFKTADEDEPSKYNRLIGMGHILPIYTTIFNHVCKNLRRLSIFYDKCGLLGMMILMRDLT